MTGYPQALQRISLWIKRITLTENAFVDNYLKNILHHFELEKNKKFIFYELHNYIVLGGSVSSSIGRLATISSPCISM